MFGFISQMPSEPIEYEGISQESFLCEMKSLGGYSGSPVFLTPDPRVVRIGDPMPADRSYLLGVDWGHIQNWQTAMDDCGYELPHIRFPTNTGMMGVVPGWKLTALLNSTETITRRRALLEREKSNRVGP